jgi:O-antigen/teichoic acid export membrane protein
MTTVPARGLVANTSVNALSKLIAIAIGLALSPFLVRELGLAVFGFWALVSSLTQYAAILDFGVGAALTRYVAVHNAQGESVRIRELASAALAFAWATSAGTVIVSIVAIRAMPDAWSQTWPVGWEWCSFGVSVSLACVLISSSFQAFPRGLGRWDLQAASGLVYQVSFGIASVALLLHGDGLAGLGTASIIAGVSMLAASKAAQVRVWTDAGSPLRAKRSDVLEIVRYGANLQTSALLSVVNTQADKPVILAMGGSLEFVGLYELASRVAFQLRTLPISALGPLTVRLASDTAGKSISVARDSYRWALNGVLQLGVAPLFGLYGACFPLIMAWLGVSYRDCSLIMAILGIGYAVNLATGAGTSLANGYGRPDLERNYSVLSLALNVGLSVGFGVLFGQWGIVVATSLSLVISSLWFMRSAHHWLSGTFDWRSEINAVSARLLVVGVAFGTSIAAASALVEPFGRIALLGYGVASAFAVPVIWLILLPGARRAASARFRRS